MQSRLNILSKLKANKPEAAELPEVDLNLFYEDQELLKTFEDSVKAVGGVCYKGNGYDDILDQVRKLYPSAIKSYSILKDSEDFNTLQINGSEKPHEFEDLDVLILEGLFGVAENGAVWLCDDQIPIRVLPFITKHLVLVVNASDLVSNMHEAYLKIEKSNKSFGVFISGPSKTADIEQALVIGAQGALTLSVFVL